MTGENKAIIRGKLTEEFVLDHESHGTRFFCAKIAIKRLSGTCDLLPVIVPEIKMKENMTVGRRVMINGSFRSYNHHEGGKSRLVLYVFAEEVIVEQEQSCQYDENTIRLNGYICKETIKRETPKGMIITDILLAANRGHGKSDYIPCISWGSVAEFAYMLGVGANVELEGRIQSRTYRKVLSDTECEYRTAYEVSIHSIKVIGDEKNDNGSSSICNSKRAATEGMD